MPDAPINPGDPQAARKVELIIAQLDSLPTLPRIATQLLRITRSEQSSIPEVTSLIKQDQAVTAKILSIARRAGSGIRAEATTIDKCVPLMGLEAVRNAALSIKVFEMFDPAADAGLGQFDLAGFWQHSLAVGVAAEMLADRAARARGPLKPPSADEAFVAGLLHDIGKAALHQCLPKSYGKVIEAAEATHSPLPALERKLIGLDHMVVGRRLAQRWNLPQGVIDAIWLHHNPPAALPDSVRERGFAALVFLADLLVREMRIGYSGNHPRTQPSAQVAKSMGIAADVLDSVSRSLAEEVVSRSAIIGMDQLDSRDLYYDALSGANDELARLNARLLMRGAKLSLKSRWFDLLGEMNCRLRTGARPAEAAAALAPILRSVLDCERIVVFSEAPAEPGRNDCPIEGVAFDEHMGDDPERFVLHPSPGEIEGLAAARRAGLFASIHSPETFALYPLEDRLAWVHRELNHPLPLRDCWLMPLPADGSWAGAAIFTLPADAELLRNWPTNRGELLAMASAAGQALRIAQTTVAADTLSEELARSVEQCVRLQEHIVQQKTMASVTQMAAGAGHELNNPLMVISGRSELLAADETDPKRRESLDQIRQNAQRASQIISELMALAHPPVAAAQKVDLVDLVRATATPLNKAGIGVSVEAAPGLPSGWADPSQLQEVLQEILDNAQQAMAAQDTNRWLTIRLREAPASEVGPASPVREIEINITDTGVGMDATVLERAMDPFFSARPAGRGRGLGLARARRLIENNAGTLRLESQPGAGTTVHVFVPAARD